MLPFPHGTKEAHGCGGHHQIFPIIKTQSDNVHESEKGEEITYSSYRCVILQPSRWTRNNRIALSDSGSEVIATVTVPSIPLMFRRVLRRSPGQQERNK